MEGQELDPNATIGGKTAPAFSVDIKKEPQKAETPQPWATYVSAIMEGKPINVLGYMCSGKTTLVELLKTKYGYDVIDESAWNTIWDQVSKGQAGVDQSKKLQVYSKMGEHLSPAYEAAIKEMVTLGYGMEKKVVNTWITYLDPPFLNIYLKVQNTPCLTKDRGVDYDPGKHFLTMDERMAPNLAKGNVLVFSTEEERNSFEAMLQGDEEA